MDKQEAYIAHFPQPKDGIERGYFQHRCQMKLRGYPFSWMLWLKVIIKVAQYSHAITQNKQQAIISCNEYSYIEKKYDYTYYRRPMKSWA